MLRYGQFADETREKIITERKKRGWSQEKLAAEIKRYGWDVRQQQITRIERGSSPITVDDLIALSFAFDIPVSNLLP